MKDNDSSQSEYFGAYEDLEVHYLMLQDEPRNEAYRRAVCKNKDFIKGKTVLDVGAGTGILSIFCAKAGASKVYAVEASGLYRVAEEVVNENKLEDIIEVIHCKVEDLTLPNDLKVDIIISEWMGFYLLHEGMLDSVIMARDKFLKEGGLMFPESATIYSAPCSVPSMYSFWNNVSGISMQSVGVRYRELKSTKPEVLDISKDNLLHEGSCIFWADLRNVTLEELDTLYFQNVIAANKSGLYQGLCLWFTCQFPTTTTDNEPVVLSTAPGNPSTHWKQTVIVLPTEIPVEQGTPIAYELSLQKSKDDGRKYDIEMIMLDSDEITHPEPCECHLAKCIIIKKMLEKYESGEINNTD